jgi:Cof subfamily protein (haloacid dehalogenase superfamily)
MPFMWFPMPKLLPNWNTYDIESIRAFSKIKLIAIDLDGTLVAPGSKSVFDTIASFQRTLQHHRYGVSLTIATGRTFTGAKSIINGLKISKQSPVVLYNGGLVITSDGAKTISHKVITAQSLNSILSIASDYPVAVYAYFYSSVLRSPFLVSDPKEVLFGWSQSLQPEIDVNGQTILWQKDWSVNENIEPVAVLIESTTSFPSSVEILEKISQIPGISPTSSGSKYIEIRPVNSNKAIGIEAAVNSLGIEKNEVLALGDNNNDREMLRWSGIGVCIAGGSKEAIQDSDYVTGADVGRGVVQVLRLVLHARRYFYDKKKSESTFGENHG